MTKEIRDTLDPTTRNEDIGGFIRESNQIAAFDVHLGRMMTVLMSGGTTSGVIAYENDTYLNSRGDPISGSIPLIAGEKLLLQFTKIKTLGTTVPVAELWAGVMAT
jgi:hypothetical protein